jgi:hypothetical protein
MTTAQQGKAPSIPDEPAEQASPLDQVLWTRTRPAESRTLIFKLPLPFVPVERQAPSRLTSPCEEKLLSAGPSTRISQAADFGR